MCLWGRVATWTIAPAPIRTTPADNPIMTGPWLSRARRARKYLVGQFGSGGGELLAIPSDLSTSMSSVLGPLSFRSPTSRAGRSALLTPGVGADPIGIVDGGGSVRKWFGFGLA